MPLRPNPGSVTHFPNLTGIVCHYGFTMVNPATDYNRPSAARGKVLGFFIISPHIIGLNPKKILDKGGLL